MIRYRTLNTNLHSFSSSQLHPHRNRHLYYYYSVYSAMPVMFLYLVVDSTKCVTLNILRSTGRPQITVWGNLVSCLAIMLPLGWVLAVKMSYGKSLTRFTSFLCCLFLLSAFKKSFTEMQICFMILNFKLFEVINILLT